MFLCQSPQSQPVVHSKRSCQSLNVGYSRPVPSDGGGGHGLEGDDDEVEEEEVRDGSA